MLRLKALTLENFGPYKDRQTVTFPDGDGVVMFYGENMRGKTTLLNAIRFALFGQIVGRGQRPGSLHLTGNWDATSPGFEVQLEMTHDGRNYRLTRTCRPKNGVGTPSRDEDYDVAYFLERDGHILSPQASADDLHRIMPPDIMRFFLFDGELLQEYEDLLHTESAGGLKISKAIEIILGMPVLTGARGTLKTVRERAESRQALAAQTDQKTRQYGTELQSLQAQAQTLAQNQEEKEEQLAAQRSRKAQIEEALRKRERLAALFDRRELRAEDLKGYKEREAQQKAQVGSAMTGAWASALRAPMVAALARLRQDEGALQLLVTRTQVLKDLANHHLTECPTCLQGVDDGARAKISAALEAQGGAAGDNEQRDLAALRRRIDALSHGVELAKPELIRARWEALEQAQRDIYEAQTEIRELDQQIDDAAGQDLRSLRLEYEALVKDIGTLEEGVSLTREALATNTQTREKLQQRLERLGGGQSTAATRERALAADLHALFDEGVTVFRDQLRRRVEADASAHFRRLTTEQDYAGLRINDSYGLTIVHRDGSDIPVRSAGAEHVVALSLVAALQNNAPMRGPIVVDSPFGRLDGEHRRRIMAALPDMAAQVVLLVYEEEMPPSQSRPALREKLLAEFSLVRRGAKHTELQPRRETETV